MTGSAEGAVDVMLVSLGSTAGLRAADAELAGSLRRAGASVALTTAAAPRPLRTLALTDLTWALAARRAARSELARRSPRAVVYCTTTAAAAVAAARRDPLRRSRGRQPAGTTRHLAAAARAPAPGAGAAAAGSERGSAGRAPGGALRDARALVVPVPVEPSGRGGRRRRAGRDIAAIAYAANPSKKGIDRVLGAWRSVRRDGEELVLAGARDADLAQLGIASGRAGVRSVGPLAPGDYRALLRRARVFVCAPRREDYGIAQLEALADGCLLVTTPAPGPYAALPIARELDERLVSEDLASALRAALDDPRPDYAARALQALAPLRRDAVDRLVAQQLLPRLLA